MFEVIIEENCVDKIILSIITPILQKSVLEIIEAYKLESLKYMVIADNDTENYENTIEKFALILGCESCRDGDDNYQSAGKTLEGLSAEGKFSQVIIIKSGLIMLMLMELNGANELIDSCCMDMRMKGLGVSCVIHEIGHAVDNENIYKIRGFVNNKIYYNLDEELNEYIEESAYSLWGEYYAEKFAYQFIKSIDLQMESEKEYILKDCIMKYSKGKSRNEIVGRVYRILYLFVHCVAFFHSQNETYLEKVVNDTILSDYIVFFAGIELAINNAEKQYPNWDVDFCMREFGGIIRDMLFFEKTH